MNRSRRWALRAAGAGSTAAAVVGFLVIGSAGPAAAAAPVRSGWWNTASAGSSAAPSNTPGGELSVSYAGQTLSYAAVAYQVSGAGNATLTLQIDAANSQGTPAVEACPTKTANWPSGGDQPASAAPSYDCSVHSYAGAPSADGKSINFLLDSGAQVSPGIYSVAIVPAPSDNVPVLGQQAPVATTAPFTVDFQTPGGDSLSGAGVSQAPVGGPGGGYNGGYNPGSSGSAGPAGSTGSTTGSGAGNAATGSAGGAAGAVTSGGATALSSGVAPANSGSAATAPVGSASAPTVAAGNSNSLAPRALTATPGTSNRLKDVALALLLVMGLVMVGTSSGVRPRLAFAGAAAPNRGIGRFARPRDARPRPLI